MVISKSPKSLPGTQGSRAWMVMLAGEVFAGKQDILYLQWLSKSYFLLEKRRKNIHPNPANKTSTKMLKQVLLPD